MMEQATGSALNEFYGSEQQLRRYHSRYLRFFDASSRSLPLLDLGCGSGVFLELVKSQGRRAIGVEVTREATSVCRAKGLEVLQDEALHHLTDKHQCYAGIFCSHLIEHLDYQNACRLLDLANAALTPGGRMILVTPNPASLEVISEVFWLDPTHVRPYPLPLLLRMVERAGLQVRAQGQQSPPGLPRRGVPRRLLLQLLLGRHYNKMDSFVVGEKPIAANSG